MACFLVPVAEAVVVTVAAKIAEKKEKTSGVQSNAESEAAVKLPFSRKLKWLRNMLWGGSALLAFEHVWHGEVVPYFPFLTAAQNPADFAEMLYEMSTVGTSMAGLVTLVWLGMVAVTTVAEKRAQKELPSKG
ncbi:MAG TPA: hypothetical protein DEO32_05810 [Ruminococcaceae bacterium]|nr:hypothetical protein [Oscillospiraceae bacterium]